MIRRSLAAATLALLLASPARADLRGAGLPPNGDGSGVGVTATGGSSARILQDRFAQQINVKDYGAKEDALACTDGIATASSTTFTSATCSFAATDIGKLIFIDGAGSGGSGGAPLATTIAGYTSAHTITLGAAATTTTGTQYFQRALVATAEASGSYIPGETVTLTGGTSTTGAVATVQSTQLVLATVNATGSGGTAGACVLTGTTGTGSLFTINATIAAGAISAVGSIVLPGIYTTNPTSLSAEPVTSNCSLTGATLTLTMGARQVSVSTAGVYSVLPSNPVATGAGSSSGATGATLTVNWNTTGRFTYGSDDTAAWTAAVNAVNSAYSAQSQRRCIYEPAGVSIIQTAMPLFNQSSGCVLGDGPHHSYVVIHPSLTGDLFSWSENWFLGNYPYPAPTQGSQQADFAGPLVEGITVIGDRLAATQQNAFMFYDRNDVVVMRDVEAWYVNGSCLSIGTEKNKTQAYMRESRFYNLRFVACGTASAPAMLITSQGSGDSTNELNFFGLDLFWSQGQALTINNSNTVKPLSSIQFFRLRLEGFAAGAVVPYDLMTIGDPVLAGIVCCVEVHGFVGNAVSVGQNTLLLTAPSAAAQPYSVNVEGEINTGDGAGINVTAGRTLRFKMAALSVSGNGLVLGATPPVGANILFEGNGIEQTIRQSIAASSVNALETPAYSYGNPTISFGTGGNLPFFSVQNPSSSILGGNARGAGACDLQFARSIATQVASGQQSCVVGGSFNTAGGQQAAVAGGSTNSAQGVHGFIGGGVQATDRARTNTQAFSGGQFATQGDAQAALFLLRGTGATGSAFRLTGDNAAAGTANCVNVPNNTAFAVTVTIMAFDHTTVTKNETWLNWTMLLTRGANAASTALVAASTPTPLTNGTLTGSAIAATADTTNGCLNISFTPPTSNTDTWNVVAKVESVEVQ